MSWEDSPVLIAALVGLHVVLLVALGASLRGAWGRASPFYTWVTAVTAGLLAGLYVERAVPARLFSVLREGFTLDHLRFAAGLGTHRGPLLRAFWGRWFFHDDLGFREIVALNTTLGVLAAVVIGGLAWERTRRWGPALLVPAVLLLHPMGRTALLSETEAPLCALYLATAAWIAEVGASRAWVITAQLASAALLAACRPELVVFPLGVVAARIAPDWAGRAEAVWSGWFDAAADAAARAPARALALFVAWIWLAEVVVPMPFAALKQIGSFGWPLVAMDPLNDRVLTLVPVLLTLLPVGFVAAVAAGGWVALRQPVRTGFIGPSLLLVYGAWYLAAHGVPHGHVGVEVASWEIYRYVELAMPVLGVLAMEGLARMSTREITLAALLCLVPPTTWAIQWLPPAFGKGRLAQPQNFMMQQPSAMMEERLIVGMAELQRACPILTQGLPWSGEPGAGRLKWAMLRRGERSWSVTMRDAAPGDDLATVAAAMLGDARCAVAYRSLDCDADHSGGCLWADGLMPVESYRQPFFPYVHPEHGQVWSRPEVELGFYEIPGYRPRP